jgi:hypothetical protein
MAMATVAPQKSGIRLLRGSPLATGKRPLLWRISNRRSGIIERVFELSRGQE